MNETPFTDHDDIDATRPWHIECLECHHRYYYDDGVTVVHNRGHDFEDSSDYCPHCGTPQDHSGHYAMHDGRIPR